MPPPFKVELTDHDPSWAEAVRVEASVLQAVLGAVLLIVHHIGSTAIPGLKAKPILDLLLVVQSVDALDQRKAEFENAGYEWWGEFGLPGRRYATKSDPQNGQRLVQLHCFGVGAPDIERHIAFRDFLRSKPDLAAAYAQVKAGCRERHPDDSHAYGKCKGEWIDAMEAAALADRRGS